MPPLAVYAVLGLISAVENVLPPVPADSAAALGAFLSHRGVTTSLTVFLVVWFTNMLGASGVYLASRRYGRRLFATPAGRRLLAPESLAVIEREYLRFGVAAIFISRFLPGIRAVVPPFAGLANLGPVRALVPMGLASAIWYGAIILLGHTIGAEWERISAILADVNRTLAVVGLGVVIGPVIWWRIHRRRRRRERLWDALDRAFGATAAEPAEMTDEATMRAAALLMLELAYLDEALTPADRELVESHLRERWGLEPAVSETPLPTAPSRPELERRLAGYAERIGQRFGRQQRLALVERLWTIVLGSRGAGMPEERLMRLSGDLLGFTPEEVVEVRQRLSEPLGG